MERRYDFDWLRVFAFAVLIFYHVGMLYVEMTAKGDLDVNHLWYLRELWCFSLILLFIHPILSVAKINNIFDLIGIILVLAHINPSAWIFNHFLKLLF